MKKILSITLVVVLLAGIAVSGTMAYLQDTASDVNVMTLGKVDIEQIEQERGEYGLQEFTDDKPAYPAVGPIEWADELVDVNGTGYKVFTDELKNVIDKIVTVKNTGKSDAFVRTIVAIEAPDYDAKNLIHINYNSTGLEISDPVAVEVDGVEYVCFVFTYEDALKPNEISAPSLMQLFLDSAADNEFCAAFGDTWEVLVLSQAIQTEGFDSAETALNAGFGAPEDEVNGKKNIVTWFEGMVEEDAAPTAPANNKAVYNGTTYDTIYEAIAAANTNGGGEINLMGSATLDRPVEIAANITINGIVDGKSAAFTRADGFTGTMFTVKNGATFTAKNVVLDGAGATATGNLIATEANAHIVLNEGAVLQNNVGAHAVNLGTRIGATLTMNDGSKVINNQSDSGAIWGGGNITINGGEISGNSSTGIGGAIRMVGSCNLTMNGGEICNNKAAGDGGAIWGYGVNGNTSVYNFNGGKISGNESAGTGGAIYTGNYSVINISGDFEMCDNKAANSGAIRLTDHTSMTMTGGKVSGNTQNGESNAFNTWNNSISITGGELADNMSFVGGLGLTIGAADIDGVISYDLSTNHNTAYLAENFNSFRFKVDEADTNFSNFNFKPAAGYTYTAGDEAKLICMNEGYSTYWDSTTGTFRLKAN